MLRSPNNHEYDIVNERTLLFENKNMKMFNPDDPDTYQGYIDLYDDITNYDMIIFSCGNFTFDNPILIVDREEAVFDAKNIVYTSSPEGNNVRPSGSDLCVYNYNSTYFNKIVNLYLDYTFQIDVRFQNPRRLFFQNHVMNVYTQNNRTEAASYIERIFGYKLTKKKTYKIVHLLYTIFKKVILC